MHETNIVTDLRTTAQHLYESGNLDGAMIIVNECLEYDRENGRTLELQGLVQYSSEQYQQSVATLESASLRVPLRKPACVCLAHGYGRIGKRELSLDLLIEALESPDIPAPLLLQIGTGLDYVDRPDLALAVCRRSADISPEYAQTWYDMGYYIGRCGGPNSTIESLARKAVELDPENMRYRVGLAGLLVSRDAYGDAHQLVKDLSNAQIESMTCRCCLQRLIDIYEFAHDYRRVVVGQQRLALIGNTASSDRC